MKDKNLIFTYKEKDLITVRYSVFNHDCFKMHMHEALSIGLILDGKALVTIEDSRYEVDKDVIVIINPRQLHACNPSTSTPWSYYMFYIDEKWCRSKIAEITGKNREKIHFVRNVCKDAATGEILRKLYRAMEHENSAMHVEELLYALLESTLNNIENEKVKEAGRAVQEAISYLEAHVDVLVSLEDLAEKVCLSPYYFLRLFKRQTGITPHKYFMNLKINRARRLLEEGACSIDVAHRLGFCDQSHFIRLFKDCTGVTPGNYSHSSSGLK